MVREVKEDLVTPASAIAALKSLLAAANPGLATQEDLLRLEQRVDDITKTVEALEARLGDKKPPAGRRHS